MTTNNSNNQTIQPMSNIQTNQPMNNIQIKKQIHDIIFVIEQHISDLIQVDNTNILIDSFVEMLKDICHHANTRVSDEGKYINEYEKKYEVMFYEISVTADQICTKYENIQADVEEPLYISKTSAMELLSGILNHCNAKVREHKELMFKKEEPKAVEQTIDYKQKYDDLLQMVIKKLKDIDESLYDVGRSLDRMEVPLEDVEFSIYGREISIDHIELDKSDVECCIGDVQGLVEDLRSELANINEGEEEAK